MPTIAYQGTLNIRMNRVPGLSPDFASMGPDRYSLDPVFWGTNHLGTVVPPQGSGNGAFMVANNLGAVFNGGLGGYNEVQILNTAGAGAGNTVIFSLVYQGRLYTAWTNQNGTTVWVGDMPLPASPLNAITQLVNVPSMRALAHTISDHNLAPGLGQQQIVAIAPGVWGVGIFGANSLGDFVYPYNPYGGPLLDFGPLRLGVTKSLNNTLSQASPDLAAGINYSYTNQAGTSGDGAFSVWFLNLLTSAWVLLVDSETINFDAKGKALGLQLTKAFTFGFLAADPTLAVQAICNRALTQYWLVNFSAVSGSFGGGHLNQMLIDSTNVITTSDLLGNFWTSYNPALTGVIPFFYPGELAPVSLPCLDPCDFAGISIGK